MTHIPDEAVQAALEYYSEGGCMGLDTYERKEVATAMIEATLTYLSAPCAVEVRGLDWETVSEYGLEYRSKTSIGFYSIHTDEDSAGGRMFCYFHLTEDADCTKYGREIYSGYGGDDEAKAAAQADFERRILACVVTNHIDVAEVRRQALEEAAKIADNGMLVPPDGGSPTEAETNVALNIAAAIRALSAELA